MAKRETAQQRSVTFTKRRHGLFNKAAELCMICNARVAIMATSVCSKEKVFSFGHSSVDAVFDAFLNGSSPLEAADDDTMRYASSLSQEIKELEIEFSTLMQNKKKNVVPQGEFSWELEQFDKSNSIEELQNLVDCLEFLLARANSKLNNSSTLGSTSGATVVNYGNNSSAGILDVGSVGTKSDDVLAIEVRKPHEATFSLRFLGLVAMVTMFSLKGNSTEYDSSPLTIKPEGPEPNSVLPNYHSDSDFPTVHADHIDYLQYILQSPSNSRYNLENVFPANNADDNNPSWTPLADAPGPRMNKYFKDTEFADWGTKTAPSSYNCEFNRHYVMDGNSNPKPDDSNTKEDFMDLLASY
ncbi:unnamed protein product [Dovyalis caffra]|uniref:MADS-box domain-containing protein n=1 Tax=Dovyalis caffra TaxID=77055 RepID=A0AAV1SG71_9ROSI|nr:unnamed protein product [Dovyalis caffra]